MKQQHPFPNLPSPSHHLSLAVAFFIGVIIIAHLITPETYSFTGNTVSELAAQGYANAWLVRLGLVVFGLAIISYIFADDAPKHKAIHAMFAVLVIGLSALFGLAENGTVDIGKGLVQKMMFVAGLSWIVINYRYLNR